MDIYGIIGYPVKHSMSPAMHNAAFKHYGIGAEYKKFEVRPEDLEDFLLNRKDVKGFNVTIPHKVRALEMIRDNDRFIHSQADMRYIEFCGAINTVKREGEISRYTNTDVSGFMESLGQDLRFKHKDKNILLIGCGGAGRAVIAGLTGRDNSCKKIYIYDNNAKAIESVKRSFFSFSDLRGKLEFITEEYLPDAIKNCQLLVNASPVGMKEEGGSVIDKKSLHKGLSIYDLVYNRETQLIKDAKSLGLRAVGGLGMLLYQGAASFAFWTQKDAPVEVMRKALKEVISV